MGFNYFQTAWIILHLVLLLNVKLIQANEWYAKFKVYERSTEDPKAEFEPGEELVKLCPPVAEDIEDFTERTDYNDECSRFLRCSTSKSVSTDVKYLFVSVETCERCHKNDKDSCPKELFIYNKELHRCVPPKTMTPDEHVCGTKKGHEEKCSGPESTEDLHKLGKSAYYIYHNENKKTWVNWQGAKDMCKKAGLNLAVIDDLQTEILVGRQLEKFIQDKGWIDNWYWIDAKFDKAQKTYVWQDGMKPIKFSNFYYRSPRPKGYGDFFDNQGTFIKEPEIEYCLAQSMPLPFPKSANQEGDLVPYGIHTAWWERECESKKKGNVLCESMDAACDDVRDQSIYTEPTGNYFEGFWPMSNRRFVVLWTAKSFEEAKTLCEAEGLKMYSPNKDDTCLPQSLKNWMKTVTSYSFWTDVKYDVEGKTFLSEGKDVDDGVRNISLHIEKREAAEDIKETCVSYTWNYEEYPKNINFCNCTVNSLALAPENCDNKIGVICQHTDDKERKCTTEFYEKAIPRGELVSARKVKVKHPKILEYYEFNADPKWIGGLFRSAYKQQGSSGQCPNNWVRATEEDTYWGTVDDYDKSNYKYDFVTPYWMKIKEGICTLSTVTYDPEKKSLTRVLTDEDCSQWLGFVLCKSKSKDGTRGGFQNPKFVGVEFDFVMDDDITEPH